MSFEHVDTVDNTIYAMQAGLVCNRGVVEPWVCPAGLRSQQQTCSRRHGSPRSLLPRCCPLVSPAMATAAQAQTGLLGSLQHLDLEAVHLESVDSLEQLTYPTTLTCLAVKDLFVADVHFDTSMWGVQHTVHSPWPTSQEQIETVEWLVQAVPGILQRLTQLSVLKLPGIPVADAAVQQLKALQGLRQVTLQHTGHAPLFNLHHLPDSITHLCVYGQDWFDTEYLTALPQQVPPQLSMLKSLELVYCDVPQTLLGSVSPQLLELRLEGCLLLPCERDTDQGEAAQTEGTAAFLDTLPRFAQLKGLLELRLFDGCVLLPCVQTNGTAAFLDALPRFAQLQ